MAILICHAEQMMVVIPLHDHRRAAGIDLGNLVAVFVVFVCRDVPQRVGHGHDFTLLSIGERGLAAQGVHNARGALPLVVIIGNDVAFRVGCNGISVLILNLIPSAVRVRLRGHAGLLIVLVLHLALAAGVVPCGHAALTVILVFGRFAVRIGEGNQIPSLVLIGQFRAARRGELDDVTILIHLDQQFFLTGRDNFCDEAILVAHDLGDVLAAVLLDALEQAARGEGVHRAVRQRNAVFRARVVIRQAFIFRGIACKRSVRLNVEDDLASIRAAAAYASVVKQAQVLTVFRRPLRAERAVRLAALAVVGADDLQRAPAQVGKADVLCLQEKVARVEVERLKAQRAEAVWPQQALVECKLVAGRVRLGGEGIIPAVEVVEVFGLGEILHIVRYALDALFPGNVNGLGLHAGACAGQLGGKPILRIVVYPASGHMIHRAADVIVVLIARAPRGGDSLSVAINIKVDFVGQRRVVPIGVRPGNHVTAELLVFIIVAVICRLHVGGRFDQAGGDRLAGSRHAFQMQGAKRYALGQHGAHIERARCLRKESIIIQFKVRPCLSVIRIGVQAGGDDLTGIILTEGFQTDGVGVPIQGQPVALVDALCSRRCAQKQGGLRAAAVQTSRGIQPQRRDGMHASVLAGQEVRGKGIAVPRAVHVQPAGGQLRRTIRLDGRHRLGELTAAGEMEGGNWAQQLHLEAHGVHLIDAGYVQALKDGSRAGEVCANLNAALGHVKPGVATVPDRMPGRAAVDAVFIGYGALRQGMEANGLHALRGRERHGG